MFVQASWKAVSKKVKYYQKSIPWEKRIVLARNKGVFISDSFHASMSNYGWGDWQQANLHRPHICLGIGCNIGEHGWLVRKTRALGEQNNSDEVKWKETFGVKKENFMFTVWFCGAHCWQQGYLWEMDSLQCTWQQASSWRGAHQDTACSCWQSVDHRWRETPRKRGSRQYTVNLQSKTCWFNDP